VKQTWICLQDVRVQDIVISDMRKAERTENKSLQFDPNRPLLTLNGTKKQTNSTVHSLHTSYELNTYTAEVLKLWAPPGPLRGRVVCMRDILI
jgi:secreted Zn-dependent insulinase-like peptidase